VTLTEFVVANVIPLVGGRASSTSGQPTGSETRRLPPPPEPREVRLLALVLKLVLVNLILIIFFGGGGGCGGGRVCEEASVFIRTSVLLICSLIHLQFFVCVGFNLLDSTKE